MPVNKQDTNRALHLLEQYHVKLSKPGDENLRNALEQVMDIFRSDLFHALIDIQEYYEVTLMDSFANSSESPASEHKRQWTNAPKDQTANEIPAHFNRQMNNNAIELSRKSRQSPESPMKGEGDVSYANAQKTVVMNTQMAKTPRTHQYENHESIHMAAQNLPPPTLPLYEYQDITLERGSAGLGFSIAGGRDNPIDPEDVSIYITKIIAGGGASADGRLRANDAIVAVNGFDTKNVCHGEAVEALTAAGSRVELRIRRRVDAPLPNFLPPEQHPSMMERDGMRKGTDEEDILDIRLIKRSKGLGFSIVGGAGNQHIPGDNSIFITKIIEGGAAESDGTLRVGDKILSVDGKSLVDVTHEEAVAILKSTSDVVNLKIIHPDFPLDFIPPPIPPFQENYPLVGREQNRGNYVGAGPTHSMGHSSMEAAAYPDEFAPETSATSHMQPLITEKPGREAHSYQNVLPSHHPLPYQNVPPHDEFPPDMTVLTNPYDAQHQYISREPRMVTLNKIGPGLGFNIVGGEGGEGIYISYILTGGTADLSGELHKGDQILSVNGIDLTKANHEEAAHALKSAENVVTMMAQYKPEEKESS